MELAAPEGPVPTIHLGELVEQAVAQVAAQDDQESFPEKVDVLRIEVAC
jgi:hypothetical protein